MITVTSLSKQFDRVPAVNDISFTVPKGQILGLLGPNGAGKSTTMKMLTGYLSPSAGTVAIAGHDVLTDSLAVRRSLGYLPESNPLYDEMNVLDQLLFAVRMREVPASRVRDRMRTVIRVCGLEKVLEKKTGTLSKGYRQRLGLAQAIVHDPPVLILDEPTSGLDPNQIGEIRSLIKTLGAEKTLILSTHILPEVQSTCDRILIMNRGRLVADGSPDELASRAGGEELIRVELKGEPEGCREKLAAIPTVAAVSHQAAGEPGTTSLLVKGRKGGEGDLRELVYGVVRQENWPLLELYRHQLSLEDVFKQLTLGEPAAKAESRRVA
ncbi:MAG: ATP-binding cassette domain-containing protein [Deltaproteobacteria bacterium]|nr:ATP-binding cassette domain-containing protein [Candidatus Anaeroferrophillus wilburensis]MBN2888398.1 ATP-binding cassette domain-containing protein [Deltaproteobacteria bacterium]